MTKIHELKLLNDFCDDVLEGRKNFEVRENDRGFQTGDHVKFKRVDRNRIEWPGHEVEKNEYVITYILSGWGINENRVVFGIKPLEEVMKLEEIEPRKANCVIVPVDGGARLDITCPWCNEPLNQGDDSKYCRMCGKPITMLTFDEREDKYEEYWREINGDSKQD